MLRIDWAHQRWGIGCSLLFFSFCGCSFSSQVSGVSPADFSQVSVVDKGEKGKVHLKGSAMSSSDEKIRDSLSQISAEAYFSFLEHELQSKGVVYGAFEKEKFSLGDSSISYDPRPKPIHLNW